MTWGVLVEVVAAAAILLGATLALIAAIGILRFPEVLSRMHSATKPQVLGLVLLLGGLALQLRDLAATALLLLIVMFQLFTSPVASHMLSRAAFRSQQVREDVLVVDELSPLLRDEDDRGNRT